MKGITGNPALDAYQRVALTPVRPAGPASKAASTTGQAGSGQAAKVSISSQARELAGGSSTQVSSQKVEALKAAVQNGSFKVDSHLVAERMLDGAGF